MFQDPIVFDAADVPSRAFRRINQDGFSSEYQSRDDTHGIVRMKIRHSYQKATTLIPHKSERHSVELLRTVVAGEKPRTVQAYIVFTVPEDASPALTVDLVEALQNFATNENVARVCGWES